MTPSSDKLLEWLKPLNDSGLINALGVIATFAAVVVALLPTFWKWKQRPKLTVLLKAVEIKNTVGGVLAQQQISTTSRMLIRNVGGSAALAVRAVVTDAYVQSSAKAVVIRVARLRAEDFDRFRQRPSGGIILSRVTSWAIQNHAI